MNPACDIILEHAWLPTGWRRDVLLRWDAQGRLSTVEPDCAPESHPEARRIAGIAIPGMPNLHSHAFQRAMSGLTEYRANPADSFWSWRTLMYAFAQKLSPPALKAIARQLYIEMLKAGYTAVCEFHYLHHAIDGQPYATPGEHALCLIEAAQEVGIGLTLLPVLYQTSGFGGQAPLAGQQRFLNSPEWILRLLQDLQQRHPAHAGLMYGVAPHSLRAIVPSALTELLAGLDAHAPVHIHIAEQQKEVDDSLAQHGARPVEWLLDHAHVDARWCLVHATHMTPAETLALAQCGAVAGICPTTEANLGDGLFNAVDYLAAGGAWGIGSDSHVSLCLREELRLFEYGQRLQHRQRNVLAPATGGSVGAHLYGQALAGGAQASGRALAGLSVGQQADLLILDATHSDMVERRGDQWLDSLLFSQHGTAPLRDVMVGGKWVVQDGRHAQEEASKQAYQRALRQLLA